METVEYIEKTGWFLLVLILMVYNYEIGLRWGIIQEAVYRRRHKKEE
jgi:hypothetical protein